MEEHRLTLPEILQWLEKDGLISSEQANNVLTKSNLDSKGRVLHPLSVIAQARLNNLKNPTQRLTLETLCAWLANAVNLPYQHIDPLKIDFSRVGEVMSGAYASRFSILPLAVTGKEVVIATAEPFIREWVDEIERIQHKSVRLVIANPEDIARFLVEFFSLARSVKKAADRGDITQGFSSFEQLVELGNSDRPLDANDRHVVHIVDWLWQYAFDQRASDIHIEPGRDVGKVRFRIDGVLHTVYQIPMPVMNAMISRIKLLGRMDVIEKRRPQDGRVKTRTPDGQEVELRLSTLPTAFGEKLVMRIFDPDVLVRDFAALGFSEDDKAHWQAMTGSPNGIVFVTGPTGSGKTTTLYTTLKMLATDEVNVSTIEDPIEMVESSFNQMQIQANIDLTFADGVRALMRQDPDIIMIGEIRDLVTAEMAIQAALTGHLVLSTLHTNDAPSAITRLIDLGVAPYLIQSTLIGVMAQRLVRTLCPHCKRAQAMSAEEQNAWQMLVKPWKAKQPAQIFHPVGCLECRMTGYSGRVGLYEILPMTLDLRRHICRDFDVKKLSDHACREGMRPLRIAGALKVAQGITSLNEVLRVAPAAEAD